MAAILIIASGKMGSSVCVCDNNKRSIKEKRLDVIKSANRWLYVTEITGNNDHPMISKSMKICGLPGDKGYPWCASSQSEIFKEAGINTVKSAAARSWFKSDIVWQKGNGSIPLDRLQVGMLIGYYFKKLGRIGHIGMLVGWDKNNAYVYEGNTSPRGMFNPENFNTESETSPRVVRDGDGFYPKTRSWNSIYIISDKIK